MAIFNGVLKKLEGSMGGMTFRNVAGQTIVSEKVTKTTNPRTHAQMARRVTLANLVSTYRLMQQSNLKGFETKERKQSDYNAFVSQNIDAVRVFLTKQQANAQACVAAPYVITAGSLPAIVIGTTASTGQWKTDISIDTTISGTTTIGALSSDILRLNTGYKIGDQISYISLRQVFDAVSEMPYVKLYRSDLILDPESTENVWATCGATGFTTVAGYLGHSAEQIQGAFAWVHSRNVSGNLAVSTQRLVVNNDILSQFSSAVAMEKAIMSYGEEKEVFLASESSKFEGALQQEIIFNRGRSKIIQLTGAEEEVTYADWDGYNFAELIESDILYMNVYIADTAGKTSATYSVKYSVDGGEPLFINGEASVGGTVGSEHIQIELNPITCNSWILLDVTINDQVFFKAQ